jgi:FkbM family methyltransferase
LNKPKVAALFQLKEKLRLIRKKWKRESYSQLGEDLAVLAYFDNRPDGFYVDVGCFHPHRYSNTRLLYELGWSGINIDLSSRKLELFEFDRKRDVNILCGVGNTETTLTSYIFGKGSALDTLDRETADKWSEQFGLPYREEQVPSRPLTAILKEQGVEKIDYLNIDVEGFEEAVLDGFDLPHFMPECISIEFHGDIETVLSSKSVLSICSHGYHLHSWIKPTCILVRNQAEQPL